MRFIKAPSQAEQVLHILRQQHRAIAAQLHNVLADPVTARQRNLAELRGWLNAHETTEAMVLRPVTRTAIIGGEAMAEARAAEERESRTELEVVMSLDPESDDFTDAFRVFSQRVIQHMGGEERYEFPLVRASRDDAALLALGNVRGLLKAMGA